VQYLGETFLYPIVDGRSLASTSTEFQFFYPCNGASLPVDATGAPSCGAPSAEPSNRALASMLGADTSAPDATFTLPKLTSPAPGVAWFVSNCGPVTTDVPVVEATPLVGQISVHPIVPGRQYSPIDLLPCDGADVPAEWAPALASLLGTTGAGEDQRFVVPDLAPPGPGLMFTIGTCGAVPPLVPFTQEAPR
jgi:hypothetical protein